MIHVCYGLYDRYGRYSKFTGTSIYSIFKNAKDVDITVHIIHDDTLKDYNIKKFKLVAKWYNKPIEFYNLSKLCAEKFAEIRTKMIRLERLPCSIGALHKFMATDVLPAELDKVIYLDSDTIVNFDISELWEVDLEEHPIAGVSEQANGVDSKNLSVLCKDGVIEDDKYFNNGVLLMNLEMLRKRNDEVLKALNFVADDTKYIVQDVFNYCFWKEVLFLPRKFNRSVTKLRATEEKIVNNIYHYGGEALDCNMNDQFNRLFVEYFIRTPWFDMSTINHFCEYVQKLHTQSQRNLINFAATLNSRRRIFCASFNEIKEFRKLFRVTSEERFINTDKPNSINSVLNHMLNTKGRALYIIHVNNYDEWKATLTQYGFAEGYDFINAIKFFTPEQGGIPIDTRPIMKMM